MIITGLALGSARHCARRRLHGGKRHGSNPKKQPVAPLGLSVPRPARFGGRNSSSISTEPKLLRPFRDGLQTKATMWQTSTAGWQITVVKS